MKRRTMIAHRWLVAVTLVFAIPLGASAALVITEIQTQTTSGTAATINGDWWELTNSGPGAINLLGYLWADDEDRLDGGDPNPNGFPNFLIAAGQSIIIIDEPSANEAAWRTNWGVGPSVEILSVDEMVDIAPPDPGGAFSGLGSANDAVFFYDPMGTLLSSYGWVANVRGTTFEADMSGNDLGLSVVGENGAYAGANGDIGSPGTAVPEPTAILMVLCGVLAAIHSRRVR